MAITRQAKEQAVAQLQEELGQLKLAVLTNYRGLTVAEISELRGQLRTEDASYRVSKNTLLRIAAANTPALKDVDPTIFTGPTALAISTTDEVAPARVIFQYAKKHAALEIVGGITGEGQVLSAADVKALATLPTREQLLAQVVGTIAAPLTGLVGTLNASVAQIAYVLRAIEQVKQD